MCDEIEINNKNNNENVVINEAISLGTIIFFSVLLSLGVFSVCFSCYRVSTNYKASDPVNYLAVGWLVLELGDFYRFVCILFVLLL